MCAICYIIFYHLLFVLLFYYCVYTNSRNLYFKNSAVFLAGTFGNTGIVTHQCDSALTIATSMISTPRRRTPVSSSLLIEYKERLIECNLMASVLDFIFRCFVGCLLFYWRLIQHPGLRFISFHVASFLRKTVGVI